MPDLMDKRSLAEQVYDYLRQLIMSGSLDCGQRISEQMLAEQTGVSRTPIRQALGMLADDGLVTIKPRSGAWVTQLEQDGQRYIAQVRLSLELLTVELLAQKASSVDLSAAVALARQAADALDAGDIALAFECDSKFHLSLAELTGNSYLVDSLSRLDGHIHLFRLHACRQTDAIAANMQLHDKLLAAIAGGDSPLASEYIRQHIMAPLG